MHAVRGPPWCASKDQGRRFTGTQRPITAPKDDFGVRRGYAMRVTQKEKENGRLHAGVDLGGTKIETVVLGGRKVLGSARAPTPQTGADEVVDAIIQSIRDAIKAARATDADLAGIGVGSPGVIGSDGSVGEARNVPGFGGAPAPLGSRLAEAFGGTPVKVDNDVRVAVRGEWKRGAGRPYRNLLGIFVGTGVGGGLILNGQLRTGHGAAGEIGHTMVKPDGRPCSCGQKGHLEAYAGRGCIEAEAHRLHDKGRHTDLFKLMRHKGRDRATSGVIAAALKHDDQVTKGLIDSAVWALGISLATAQNLLDLDAIVIGGGLGDRLGDPFVAAVREATLPHLFVPDRPPVFLGTELRDLSGAVGAA
ncbi:MAG: ROK family protein, partial [Candidatus Dormibacteraceae bacterium]